MRFHSNDRSLRQILTSNFFFIPRFQRPYSWTKENVEELWEDAIQERPGDYFIGSMVVYPKGKDTVAVVDGQQRLTTLMMLLCALRDKAADEGHDKLANGTHTFVERLDEHASDRFVLNTETSYPFLHDEVLQRGEAELGEPAGREERGIRDAYELLKSRVDEEVEKLYESSSISARKLPLRVEKKLEELRDRILDLKLIFIEVATKEDATTIFVTLNSRGKDLEPADLVKAQILHLLPPSGALDTPVKRWDKIIEKFDSSEADLAMTEFLLAVWRSRFENVTGKKLAKAVRRSIRDKKDAKELLDTLTADAELYRQVNEPSYRKWGKGQQEPAESLAFFRDFGIRQPMPLLLALMREFDGKQLSLKQLKRSLRAIENYHFTYNVLASKSSTGGMSAFYAKRARELLTPASGNARGQLIDDLVKELKMRRPSDLEFDEAFGDLWLTNSYTSDKKVIQYILRRFHQHDAGDGVDFDKMTIEHLSSQKDESGNVGELGNLILVNGRLNGELDSASFPKKKEILKAAKGQWVPEEVLKASRWGSAQINRRTESLSRRARGEVWSG